MTDTMTEEEAWETVRAFVLRETDAKVECCGGLDWQVMEEVERVRTAATQLSRARSR